MRYFINVVNLMGYVLIVLLFLNNIACTNSNQKNSQASVVQNEPVMSPATDGKNDQKTQRISSISNDKLAWAQQNLDLLGYHPGNVEGKWTPQTRMAWAKFQKKSGLPETDTLDSSTFQALEQAVQSLYNGLSQPPVQQRETVRLRPPLTTDKPEKPSVTVTQDKPTTLPRVTTFTNIQAVGVHLVAAYLAEAGYFQRPLKQAKLETVATALNTFQLDIGVKPIGTGILDGTTWDKLQRIKLSYARKAELEAAIAFDKQEPVNSPSTEQSTTIIVEPTVNSGVPIIAKKPAQVVMPSLPPAQLTVRAAQPKSHDPTMPTFTLKKGESVYVIDQIECKSEHEAFVLFYRGQLQQLQNDKAQVQVNQRYALWYDINEEGVSDQNWLCIPKKRFCYSSINFTDWHGKLKPNDVGYFKEKLTLPSYFNIVPLVAKSSKQACFF